MLKHPSPFPNVSNGLYRQFPFSIAWFCELPQPTPCSAWWMSNNMGTAGPFAGVPVCIPNIAARNGLVVAIGAGE